jgi:probable F420-dependent oxidoreductase
MIRLGLQLPHFGPHATPDGVVEFAKRAEHLGFDSLWVGDHVVLPTQTEGDYPYQKGGLPAENLSPFYEALTTLSYVAGTTSRVRLGTSILVAAYRHPVLAAKMLSTLDVLSRGRLVLGLGAGWLPEEFELTGAPEFARRGAALEEIVAIYDRLWSERVTRFDGQHWRLREMIFDPPPEQRPRPPVWIGGNTKPALRRAARIGDGWHAARLSPRELANKIAELRRLTEAVGRDPDAVEPSVTCLLRFSDAPVDHERQRDLVGSPDIVGELIRAYAEAGAQTIVMGLDPREPLARRFETIEAVARDIMPSIAAR